MSEFNDAEASNYSDEDELYFEQQLRSEEEFRKANYPQRVDVTKHLIGTPMEILSTSASIGAIGLYFTALVTPENYYLRQADFRYFCNCSRTTYKKCFEELEKLGFVIRKRYRHGSKNLIQYIFMESVTKNTIARVFN